MNSKAEMAPLSSEGPSTSSGEKNHKKRRLYDSREELGPEAIPLSSTIAPIVTGIIDAHQSPFLKSNSSVPATHSNYPLVPPPVPPRRSYFSSYSVSQERRASIATTPPAFSPRSTGSRDSSPPRAGSADFARGQITPPLIPFQPDPPSPGRSYSFQPISLLQRDPFASTITSNEYVYHPITSDQVRLLALHRGNSDEAIHCSLKTMSVSELEGSQLGYHALSYAWGEEVLEKIYVGDVPTVTSIPYQQAYELPPKEFYVRTNLYGALKRLRCKNKDLWFWIDAICINQKDTSEKSHQIPKMLDIYGNAWSVCIWLGETNTFTRLGGPCHDPLDFVSVIVNLKLLDRIISGEVAEETLVSFINFADLLKRPWFRRRWVIQEVAASKRAFVQCGEKKVNWIDFADAVQLFLANIERIRTIYYRSELSTWNPDAFGHVESVGAGAIVRAANSVLRKSEEGKIVARLWDIESLVITFLHYEASDTRDTVYALLSLANDKDFYLGAPMSSDFQEQSYKKTTAQVYAEFVYHCVQSSNSLDIICRHWALPHRNPVGPALPSWTGVVTDSSFGPSPKATGRLNGDSLVGKPGHRIYNTSRGLHPIIQLHVPNPHPDYHHGTFRIPQLGLLYNYQGNNSSTQGQVSIVMDEQAVSKAADEKRKRNAGASARFRARREQKELQMEAAISSVKQHSTMTQMDGVDGNENIIRTTAILRIEGTAQTNDTDGTKNTYQTKNIDSVEYSMRTEHPQGYTNTSSSGISVLPRPEPQSKAEGPKPCLSILTPVLPSSQHDSAIRRWMSNSSGGSFDFGTSINLVAAGYSLCRITRVSSCVVDGIISHDGLEVAGWDRGIDINDIPDRLWRTLVADRTDNGSNAPSWWRRACMYCLSKASPDGDLNTSKLIANKSFPETVLEFLKRVQANVWNRKFFACQDSPDVNTWMYGLGSRNIQEGDWCCILFGCSVPVVLREEQEKPFFKFVSECYINGMMDGQALDIMEARGIPAANFPMR